MVNLTSAWRRAPGIQWPGAARILTAMAAGASHGEQTRTSSSPSRDRQGPPHAPHRAEAEPTGPTGPGAPSGAGRREVQLRPPIGQTVWRQSVWSLARFRSIPGRDPHDAKARISASATLYPDSHSLLRRRDHVARARGSWAPEG